MGMYRIFNAIIIQICAFLFLFASIGLKFLKNFEKFLKFLKFLKIF